MSTNFLLIEEQDNRGLLNLGEADIDDAVASLESLAKIDNILTQAIENEEGITSYEANAIEVSLEALCKNISFYETRVFALEGYTGKTNNILSAKIATENISDKIKQVVKKIIEWLKKAISWIIDSLIMYSSNYKNIMDKAHELKLKADAIGNKKPARLGIESQKFANFFRKDNKQYKTDEVLKAYKDHCSAIGNNFSLTYLKNILSRLSKTVDSINKDSKLEDVLKETDGLFKDLLKTSLSYLDKERIVDSNGETQYENYSYDLNFAQQKIEIIFSKEQDMLKGMSVQVTDSSYSKQNDKTTVEVLSPGEISQLASAIENEMMFGYFKHYKEVNSDLKRLESLIIKATDNIYKKDDSPIDSFSVKFLKDIVSSSINLIHLSHKFDSTVAKYCLAYCEESINSY